MSCDADPEYERLLKGKRVIIVGPSRTSLGTGQGDAIDGYDIVVRFNDAIEHMPFRAALPTIWEREPTSSTAIRCF